ISSRTNLSESPRSLLAGDARQWRTAGRFVRPHLPICQLAGDLEGMRANTARNCGPQAPRSSDGLRWARISDRLGAQLGQQLGYDAVGARRVPLGPRAGLSPPPAIPHWRIWP